VIVFTFYSLGESGMIFNFYFRTIECLPSWLYKPLGGCVRCMSGQVALWFFLIKYFHSYNIVDHLFFCSAVILLTTLINYVYERTAET
jgi:hypothetical protein